MANLLESSKEPIIKQIIDFHEMGIEITELLLTEPSVVELMKSNQTFDAVISEVFLNEAHFGLAEHFKAPLIGLGTFGAISWNTDLVSSSLKVFNRRYFINLHFRNSLRWDLLHLHRMFQVPSSSLVTTCPS